MTTIFTGDVELRGATTIKNLDALASIENADVSATAAIAATKLVHRHAIQYRQTLRKTTHRVRSVWFDLDNGAASTIDDVLAKPTKAITVTGGRIIYQDATSGTVAGGDVRVGTTLGAADVVAATNYENAKAVGTSTDLTIAAGAIAADGSVFVRHTGVAATQAGQASVELDYTLDCEDEIVAATVPIHVVRGTTATLIGIEAMAITAPTGAMSATVDLQWGNQSTAYATALSSVITLDSTTANREVLAGTLSTTALTDGDSLQLVIAVSGASGSQGTDLSVTVTMEEDP